jgi:hypothetical protein
MTQAMGEIAREGGNDRVAGGIEVRAPWIGCPRFLDAPPARVIRAEHTFN